VWSDGQLERDVDRMSASSDSEVAQLEDIGDQHAPFNTGICRVLLSSCPTDSNINALRAMMKHVNMRHSCRSGDYCTFVRKLILKLSKGRFEHCHAFQVISSSMH